MRRINPAWEEVRGKGQAMGEELGIRLLFGGAGAGGEEPEAAGDEGVAAEDDGDAGGVGGGGEVADEGMGDLVGAEQIGGKGVGGEEVGGEMGEEGAGVEDQAVAEVGQQGEEAFGADFAEEYGEQRADFAARLTAAGAHSALFDVEPLV